MDPYIGQIMLFAGNFAPQGWALCNGATIAVTQNAALYSIIGTMYGGTTTQFKLPNLMGRVPIGMGNYSDPSGIANYSPGITCGSLNSTLTISNMPAHTHVVSTPSISVPANGFNVTTNVNDVNINATASYGVPATTDTSSPSLTPGPDYVLGASRTSTGGGINTYYKPIDTTKNVSLKQSNITVTGTSKVTATSSLGGTATATIGAMSLTTVGGNAPFSNMQPSLVMNYVIATAGIYPTRD